MYPSPFCCNSIPAPFAPQSVPFRVYWSADRMEHEFPKVPSAEFYTTTDLNLVRTSEYLAEVYRIVTATPELKTGHDFVLCCYVNQNVMFSGGRVAHPGSADLLLPHLQKLRQLVKGH